MTMSSAQITGIEDSHITWLSDNIGLHHDVVSPWQTLQSQAKEAGFDLVIASGFRNFSRQCAIWNRKFHGELAVKNSANEIVDTEKLTDIEKIHAIMLYSALPSGSRHHWGTDIDVYASNLLPSDCQLQLEPWEYQQDGYFFELSKWLKAHAPALGFGFPYDKYRQGVAIEPWHLSYLPLANKCQQALSIGVITKAISEHDVAAKSEILTHINTLYQQYIINTGVNLDG